MKLITIIIGNGNRSIARSRCRRRRRKKRAREAEMKRRGWMWCFSLVRRVKREAGWEEPETGRRLEEMKWKSI